MTKSCKKSEPPFPHLQRGINNIHFPGVLGGFLEEIYIKHLVQWNAQDIILPPSLSLLLADRDTLEFPHKETPTSASWI